MPHNHIDEFDVEEERAEYIAATMEYYHCVHKLRDEWDRSIMEERALKEKKKEVRESLRITQAVIQRTKEMINVFPLELPAIPLFTEIGDEKPFSLWLRRLEDIQRIVLAAPADERKSYFLTAHLNGLARDKVDELPKEARTNHAELRSHLKTYFDTLQSHIGKRPSIVNYATMELLLRVQRCCPFLADNAFMLRPVASCKVVTPNEGLEPAIVCYRRCREGATSRRA
ncbi:unnamed protein product [Heligmosomoides polygyrus]|uniref:Uncharacterized protein n=1 Tax=Heligmosomoides polygyrus TaxID=6339 RepID=A0A183G4D3_HELPZ|nr:unnamed protein product [Heligmosomoides polygyrus]